MAPRMSSLRYALMHCLLAAALWATMGCAGGCSENHNGNPDAACDGEPDPCPNDMTSNASGCVWDRCAPAFGGTLLPCFWTTDALTKGVVFYALAGERWHKAVYLRGLETTPDLFLGEVWTLDLETGQEQQVSETGKSAFQPVADEQRIAWWELVPEAGGIPRHALLTVYDLNSGEIQRADNPEHAFPSSLSISGSRLVYSMWRDELCEDPQGLMTMGRRHDLWLYDTGTQLRESLEATIAGDSVAYAGMIVGDVVAFVRASGFCAQTRKKELYILDLSTAGRRLVADLESIGAMATGDLASSRDSLAFDGSQVVARVFGSRVVAIGGDTGNTRVLVPFCGTGGCHIRLGDGFVAYELDGENDQTYRRTHVTWLESGESELVTDIRPYHDASAPMAAAGHRLLWWEQRGESIRDACGVDRPATGRTALYLWKDLQPPTP